LMHGFIGQVFEAHRQDPLSRTISGPRPAHPIG
jgi:hypothetical protein